LKVPKNLGANYMLTSGELVKIKPLN
jgi:hypothetical protein